MKLFILPLILSLVLTSLEAKEVVNDVTQINPISMNRVVSPKTVSEVQEAIKNSTGPLSIGGGRYSMGGQTAIENGVQIDMTKMAKVVNLPTSCKSILSR
jgi:FAD/FMN-containing dehydrogenase